MFTVIPSVPYFYIQADKINTSGYRFDDNYWSRWGRFEWTSTKSAGSNMRRYVALFTVILNTAHLSCTGC